MKNLYDSPGMFGHEPTTQEETERGYVIGDWNGFPKFSCTRCPFDVLQDEQTIKDHVFHRHVFVEAQAELERISHTAKATLFDPSGKMIDRIPNPEPPSAKEEIVQDAETVLPPESLLAAMASELEAQGIIEPRTPKAKKGGK